MVSQITNIVPNYKFTGNYEIPVEKNKSSGNDSLTISNTAKAFAVVDKMMNLGKEGRFNLEDINNLNNEEKKDFYKMLSSLLQKGILGYEELEVNGKKEKHFIVNQIGNERLKGAKLYRKNYFEE